MSDNYDYPADFISKNNECNTLGVSISFYFILHNDAPSNNIQKKTKKCLF